ncbi:hypothetical protein LTS15_010058 [Exophiala xenobiotica]|nr:hypothetical protein LTS15_010058 [Exophiala xenobiotica]
MAGIDIKSGRTKLCIFVFENLQNFSQTTEAALSSDLRQFKRLLRKLRTIDRVRQSPSSRNSDEELLFTDGFAQGLPPRLLSGQGIDVDADSYKDEGAKYITFIQDFLADLDKMDGYTQIWHMLYLAYFSNLVCRQAFLPTDGFLNV